MGKGKKREDPLKNNKNDPFSEPTIKPDYKAWIVWPVFLFAISVVSISLISAIFPAMIGVSVADISDSRLTPEPFETGVWSGGIIFSSIITLGLTGLYYKKKMPQSIANGLQKLFSFEVSKKVSTVAMAVILAIYISASAGELGTEEIWADYNRVKERLQTWSLESIATSTEPHVRYFLITSSYSLFGNYAVLPFLASISLVVVTFLITTQITKKRFAGIISAVILLQSNVFLTFDTSVAYDNFWILFYLLSLYLAVRFYPVSPFFYLLSIPSKALTVLFLPMSIYYFVRSKISRNKKIVLIIVHFVIIAILISVVSTRGISFVLATGEIEGFDAEDFWIGFASFAAQLRLDGMVLLFILPLMVGLFIAARHGINHAESVMVLISGMLIIAPILTGFSEQTNQPYRFVPLVVFFAMGVGILLSRISPEEQLQSK